MKLRRTKLKAAIIALMIALTLQQSQQRVQASALALGGFCVAAATCATIGVIYLFTCEDKSYCVRLTDENGHPTGSYFCLYLKCRRDAAFLTPPVHIDQGPFNKMKVCAPNCDTNNFPALTWPIDVPEFPIPFPIPSFDEVRGTMHVLRTTDMANGVWTEIDSFPISPYYDENGQGSFTLDLMYENQPTSEVVLYNLVWIPE